MPTLRLSSSSSSSLSRRTLFPATRTSPLSGKSRPTIWRSSTLLPVPEGPMTTEIFPAGIWQLTPSRTCLSSKALKTSSISTMFSPLPVAIAPLPPGACTRCFFMSRGNREVGVGSPEDLGEDRVDDDRQHQADGHRLGDGAPDTDGAAFDVVAVIDADANHEE